MQPCGTLPIAVIETIIGPGVLTVSPPSKGMDQNAASSPSPRAKNSIQAASMFDGNASASRKPSGSAPLAARSDTLTRSALRAMASGASSAKK